MHPPIKHWLSFLAAFAFVVAATNLATAQSGSRRSYSQPPRNNYRQPPRSTQSQPRGSGSSQPYGGGTRQPSGTSGQYGLRPDGSSARGMPSATAESRAELSRGVLQGYCAVCLRDMKKWVRGTPNYRVAYDGKDYFFPGPRQRNKFMQDPAKYVPALHADCAVCYAKTGDRVPGNLNFGLNHKGRFYFFASDAQRKDFRENTSKYENADLALDGNCPVCLADMNETVPGKPEFTAVYQGLRYQFPSDSQLQMFSKAPAKYVSTTTAGQAPAAGQSPPAAKSATDQSPPAAKSASAQVSPAFEGFCPVCLKDKRQWIKGSLEYSAMYDGRRYLFPGDEQRTTFLADPLKYVAVLGGDCTVCLANMDKRIEGNVRHSYYYKDRLYLFASAEQRKAFEKNPAAFADADLALGGHCPVCRADDQTEVPGKQEFLVLHDGMRYLFPTEEHMQTFVAEPEKYKVRPTGEKQTARPPTTEPGRQGIAAADAS